jgi:hypothetical protein
MKKDILIIRPHPLLLKKARKTAFSRYSRLFLTGGGPTCGERVLEDGFQTSEEGD